MGVQRAGLPRYASTVRFRPPPPLPYAILRRRTGAAPGHVMGPCRISALRKPHFCWCSAIPPVGRIFLIWRNHEPLLEGRGSSSLTWSNSLAFRAIPGVPNYSCKHRRESHDDLLDFAGIDRLGARPGVCAHLDAHGRRLGSRSTPLGTAARGRAAKSGPVTDGCAILVRRARTTP